MNIGSMLTKQICPRLKRAVTLPPNPPLIWGTALAMVWLALAPLTAWAGSTNTCWLAEELKLGGFTVKLFLTESHQESIKGENLETRYPGGQYDKPVEMTEAGWRNLFFEPPYVGHLEIWRGDKLVYLIHETGSFGNYSGLDRLFTTAKNYPRKGCTTSALYFNTGGLESMAGLNLMLTRCPQEERLTVYRTKCHFDVLYERITGGVPDEEFARVMSRKPAGRQVCDSALNGFGPVGSLPSPVRLVVFDSKENKWRADKQGEFPAFYFRQVPVALSYADLEITTPPPASRPEVVPSGQALMAELLTHKKDFVRRARLDLALVTYSLLMMDLPEEEVKDFFMAMVAEYIKAHLSFDWGKTPEKTFAAIAAAARNFQPIEHDQAFPVKK